MSDNNKLIPTVALRGMTILPEMIVHFDVSRKMSIQAIENAMMGDQRIFLIAQRKAEETEPVQKDLYKIGTICVIKQVIKLPNNILRVLVEGEERAELKGLTEGSFLESEVSIYDKVDEVELSDLEREAMLRNLKEIFLRYGAENVKLIKELSSQVLETAELESLVDLIAINIPIHYEERQELLEAVHIEDRYELLEQILVNETEIMRIKRELQTKVKEKINENQKEYILREQLKIIKEELGEDSTSIDADQYLKQLEELNADDNIKGKIKKEIERFRNIASNSAESTVARNYIETLVELPWDKASEDNEDIKNAMTILNEDHYGLEKVKERVVEFLAVRTLTKKGESPIVCLVGPPGTGKTSIAKSVARALDKKYIRICLGGVRDEAEIRGHRRTYVGAMPGRIANGLKSAGVKNPLMLLDEIDKASNDHKGDTHSALLEVLDSEQNCKFIDHYVELPLDLSEVLFIATANTTETIPRPLLDRMEIIDVGSYTENEKFHIAKEHLIRKQIEKNGLKKKQITIVDNALKKMIAGYTKEAGVRALERKIGQICRKTAREILEKDRKSLRITETNLVNYLGKEKYNFEKANEEDAIGIVRGLAWTSVGGDTLQIEVNIMNGKGALKLTGKMGDVMKESAQTGISFVRSIADKYGITDDFFRKHDIHLHIPEGAVPKDGPSAGITMATAILSAAAKIYVKAKVAMTGEITLRGRVLPVGGLKEKILAAHNAGIKTIIVPKKNIRDIEEISEEIKEGLEFIYAECMEDVLEVALVQGEDV